MRLPMGAFTEGDQLSYAFLIESLSSGSKVVEIGAWKGRSLCSIADSILEKNSKVFAIDHFIGSESEPVMVEEAAMNNVCDIFLNNIKKFNIASNIDTLKMDSVEASKKFADDSVDLVFIDGDHSYPFVKRDLEAWYPKVRVGGFISGHDYDEHHEGLVKAVKGFFSGKGEILVKNYHPTSVWYHKKQGLKSL